MSWSVALTAFFIALPFLPALNLSEGVDLSAARVLVPLLAAAWFVAGSLRGKLRVPISPPVLAFAAFTAVAMLSAAWAAEPGFALRKALFLWSLLPTVVLAAAIPLERCLRALTIGVAASAAIGLAAFVAQFFFGGEAVAQRIAATIAPVLFGGSAAGAVSRFPSWYVDLGAGMPLLRAFLPFPDPHTAALFWGMGFPLAYSQRHRANGTKRSRYALFIAHSLLVAGLLATFSRGGYVALVTLVVAYGAWRAVRGDRRRIIRAALAAAIIAAVFFGTIGRPVADRFSASFDPNEGSVAERLAIWRDAVEMFVEEPLLGVGLGNFAVTQDPFASYRTPTNAHSTYLEIAAELGLVGLVFFGAALGSALGTAYRRARCGSRVHLGVAGALFFFAVHAIFEVDLYSPANLVVFLGLLAVAGMEPNNDLTANQRIRSEADALDRPD